MTWQKAGRYALLAACALGLGLTLHSAIRNAQAAPKSLPMKAMRMRRVAMRSTAIIFHTKSQAVVDRIIRALRKAPGNYRIVSRKPGAKRDTVLVSHGKLSLRDVMMVQQAIAYSPGLGNQANVRDYVTVFSSVTQVLISVSQGYTAVIVSSTQSTQSSTGGTNPGTGSGSGTGSTGDSGSGSSGSTGSTGDTGSGSTGSTGDSGSGSGTGSTGDSGSGSSGSSGSTSDTGSGSCGGGTSVIIPTYGNVPFDGAYWERLQEALVGVDARLYQMDIVDARALKRGQYVRIGSITGKGVAVNKSALPNGMRGVQGQTRELAP